MGKKITLGEEIDLKLSARYYRFNRDAAVKDVFDALVELVTNSDDSYHRLFKKGKRGIDGGEVLIEISAKRGTPSHVVVRDKAEGITLKDMQDKLGVVGVRSSEDGDRGFMARGAKDCSALGDVTFDSIKNNKLYSCKITNKVKFIPIENGSAVYSSHRKKLGIKKGNGTVVTIEIKNQPIPQVDTIVRNLSLHFAMRDILAEKGNSDILIRKMNSGEHAKKIIFYKPESKLVCDEKFNIPGYRDASARIVIWKSTESLTDISDKFRRSGLLIKGVRAIHECSLLHSSFEKDEYAKHYFGRIECPYIDDLLLDYDKKIDLEEDHPLENPKLVVDPNRQHGLNREHPFTKVLLEIPTKKLKELIDKDRAENEKDNKEIANKETKGKLDMLAKAASKFFKEEIDDLDQITTDDEFDKETFAKKGVFIYPTYANISVNAIRTFTYYVNKKLFDVEGNNVKLHSDSSAVEIVDNSINLEKHKKDKNLLVGRFALKGKFTEEGIYIEATCKGAAKAEALVSVKESLSEERVFKDSLEFEHSNYKIKEKSTKTLKLFAKYPEVVNKEVSIKIEISDEDSLILKNKCKMSPIAGSNYAIGEVKIEAKRLVKKPVEIKASCNEFIATSKVKIVQKDESGPNIKIEFRDEDFANYRATWGELEGKPNLLLISAKHPSIKRYLGPPPEFVGQNTILFKTILAEVVSESVCRKALRLETENQSWKYNWADKREDSSILEDVFYCFAQKMRAFLPIAHKIMIKDSDVTFE